MKRFMSFQSYITISVAEKSHDKILKTWTWNTKHLYESEKLFSCLTLKKMNVFGMFLEIIWWNGNSFVNLRIFWVIFISFSIQVERFIFKRKNSPFIAVPAQHGLHLHNHLFIQLRNSTLNRLYYYFEHNSNVSYGWKVL